MQQLHLRGRRVRHAHRAFKRTLEDGYAAYFAVHPDLAGAHRFKGHERPWVADPSAVAASGSII